MTARFTNQHQTKTYMKTVITMPVSDTFAEEACQSFLYNLPVKTLKPFCRLLGAPIRKYKQETVAGIASKLREEKTATLTLRFTTKVPKPTSQQKTNGSSGTTQSKRHLARAVKGS